MVQTSLFEEFLLEPISGKLDVNKQICSYTKCECTGEHVQ